MDARYIIIGIISLEIRQLYFVHFVLLLHYCSGTLSILLIVNLHAFSIN